MDTPILTCSFCNKSQRDVKKLIAGPNVQICDECVDICLDIVNDEPTERLAAQPWSAAVEACTLCRLPTTLEQALMVENRGFLCPGCVTEVEAALATRRSEAERV